MAVDVPFGDPSGLFLTPFRALPLLTLRLACFAVCFFAFAIPSWLWF